MDVQVCYLFFLREVLLHVDAEVNTALCCVGIVLYEAVSILPGLLELILYSCEATCCKVSASVKQSLSIACEDMSFGTLALAFLWLCFSSGYGFFFFFFNQSPLKTGVCDCL